MKNGVRQIEIVVGAIQVGGHHRNEVGTVLQVVALAKLDAGNLGDRIRLIGIFERRGEERILGHGLRGLPRIDAGAAQKEQLLYPIFPGIVDHVVLDGQVLIDKPGL